MDQRGGPPFGIEVALGDRRSLRYRRRRSRGATAGVGIGVRQRYVRDGVTGSTLAGQGDGGGAGLTGDGAISPLRIRAGFVGMTPGRVERRLALQPQTAPEEVSA